ncbi:MAG: aldo/keto reductase [Polyangiaceae bacterium]|nr:aldo/keto reductase [Polyangiaceae bacterium]
MTDRGEPTGLELPRSTDAYLTRPVTALRKTVFRLGLAASAGLDAAGVSEALEGPIRYVLWYPSNKPVTEALHQVVRRDRERYVIATGPLLGYFGGSVRRAAERALRILGSDYLDVFQLFWAGRMSALTNSTLGELVKLRQEGKVRAIGVSIHDRKRAGRLALDSPLDLLMVRYNAAHPGAEQDVFPHLAKRAPAIVAYTATSWRKLLRRPSGWEGPVPTAGDCYRFCLTSPHVDVVLTAPKNRAELAENLAALDKGPLSEEELRTMYEFGRMVHG